MEIGLVPALFKMEAARARGEQISEFKIARLYVDSMWSEIEEMFESGISKADVVGMLMMTARVSRSAAYNTLTNRLNSNLNRNRKTKETVKTQAVKTKTEVSKAKSVVAEKQVPVEKLKVAAAPAPVPVEKPKAAPATSAPSPAPAANISAPAESIQQPKPFRVGIKIGTGFHGVDDVGPQADREREESRMALKGLEAMEKRLGTAAEFLKQQENKDA